MVFCNDCMYCHELRTAHEYFCSNFCCYIGALGCDEGTQKPQTNADRIRSMTDEKLAERFYLFLCVHVLDDKVKCKDDGCKKCWMKWLREEYKNES